VTGHSRKAVGPRGGVGLELVGSLPGARRAADFTISPPGRFIGPWNQNKTRTSLLASLRLTSAVPNWNS
jgi:hypothetical protein